jgi:hypothetical protein
VLWRFLGCAHGNWHSLKQFPTRIVTALLLLGPRFQIISPAGHLGVFTFCSVQYVVYTAKGDTFVSGSEAELIMDGPTVKRLLPDLAADV